MKNNIVKKVFLFFPALLLSLILFSQTRKPVAVAAATQLNIVYVGLENPIRIAVSGVPSDKVTVTTSLGTITKISDGNYSLTVPDTRGEKRWVTIFISYPYADKILCDSQEFRIKYVPRPETTFAGYSEGTIPMKRVLEADSISFGSSCFLFEGINYIVTEFDMVLVTHDSAQHDTSFYAMSTSSKLTQEMKVLLKTLKKGDKIIIANVYGLPVGNQVKDAVKSKKVPDLVLTVGD